VQGIDVELVSTWLEQHVDGAVGPIVARKLEAARRVGAL